MKRLITIIVNKILSDKGLSDSLISEADVNKYIDDVDNIESHVERFKCSADSVHYYVMLCRAINNVKNRIPNINNVGVKSFNVFKSAIGDVKGANVNVVVANDIITSAERYSKLLMDDSFFYSECLSLEDFISRYETFLDGGTIWRKYREEKNKDNIMPTFLRNAGFIDEANISKATTEVLLKVMESNILACVIKNKNEGVEALSDLDYEMSVTKAYKYCKVWTARRFKYPNGGTFKINYNLNG